MVGLVIVSHSRKLAEATVDFIKQITTSDIPIAAAGGVGDNRETLGTDATDIIEAIQKVYSNDGVLVLMDMGSALLSAETALEFLDEEQVKNIKICSAPIVEGGMSAAIQIGMDSSLDEVIEEALNSLDAKKSHLNEKEVVGETAESNAIQIDDIDGIQKIFTIHTIHGLHARPAAKMVQLIGKFRSDVLVTNITRNLGPVKGRSLNKLSSLNVLQGDQILVVAKGKEKKVVINAIEALVKKNFGEPLIPIKKPVVKRKRPNGAIGVSDGIAIGKAYRLHHIDFKIDKSYIEDIEEEKEKFKNAVVCIKKEIDQRIEELGSKLSNEELEIFEAHGVLLYDPELYDETIRLIQEKKYSAPYAWGLCVKEVKKQYESLGDAYLQMRAGDVHDIGSQVLRLLTEQKDKLTIKSKNPVILFANDLTPSETASLDFSIVQGIVTKTGGPTSHSAILSRALGIPAVSGYSAYDSVAQGDSVAINGFNGEVNINPTIALEKKMEEERKKWLDKKLRLLELGMLPAKTQDGMSIEVLANISSLNEAEMAAKSGGEGIGLLRTEFLFLDRNLAPTEDEQYDALKKIGQIMESRPIVIRTLDIGGDKILPYVSIEQEENPFLGVRGIRLYDKHPDIFQSHIRAILRAGLKYDFQIMLPMVSKGEEFLQIKKEINKIHKQLERERIPHKWPISMGVMIETPSSVMMAKELAKLADFFSIGTNDLTQYIMAAERGNPLLTSYADPLYPSVVRSIQNTITAAHEEGIKVSVCGEIGSDSTAIPLLVGMGIDKISLNPVKIPEIKEIIRNINKADIEKRCEEILSLETAKDIRDALSEYLEEKSF